MIHITESKSAEAARKYFDSGLARPDYYVAGDPLVGPVPSLWGGRGAEMLGLRGPVERDDFLQLCDNEHPRRGGRLTVRTKSIRRVAYDFTFDPSKSYSVVWALSDPELMEVFRSAVQETMELLERDTRTRVRVNGANELRTTGNMVWATFVHGTTRPIGGVPDMHLHAHVFVFNATHDAVEDKWKAADFSDIKRNASYYESYFHSRLVECVRQLGYDVRQAGRSWELAHVPDSVIHKFSRRTQEIEDRAKAQGITDPKQKAELGLRTRHRKSESLPASAVRADWERRLTPDEQTAIRQAKTATRTRVAEVDVDALLSRALEDCLKYESLTTAKQLVEVTLRLGVGQVTVEAAEKAIERANVIRREIDGQSYLSTKEAGQYEQQILARARAGRGVVPALAAERTPQPGDDTAVNPILTQLRESRDRITLIRAGHQGFPAALEREVTGALLADGQRLIVLTGDPPRTGAGPKVPNSRGRLVGEFLGDSLLVRSLPGQTVWVRNSERVPLCDLSKLCQLAGDYGARVVLAAGQLRTGRHVPGDMLSALERFAGLRSAERETARRAHDEHRQTYQDLKQGRFAQAVTGLDRRGGIREVRDADVFKQAAKEFVAATRQRKSPIIVSNGDPIAITQAVRIALHSAEHRKVGRKFERLVREPYSDEQRRDPRVYQRGQVVQFFKSVKGFKAGQRYRVMGPDPFGNILARKGAWVEALPLSKSDHFALFKRSTIELRRGDFIRITTTGRSKNERFGFEQLLSPRRQAVRLANLKMMGLKSPDRRYRVPRDSHHRITGFTLKGDIKLDNGWVLPRDFGHFDYGYCVAGGARTIGSFGKVLIVDAPSTRGQLPGLEGLVSERVPEVSVITANMERIRSTNRERNGEPEQPEMNADFSFEHAQQRSAEREFEADYVEEQQYER